MYIYIYFNGNPFLGEMAKSVLMCVKAALECSALCLWWTMPAIRFYVL